MSINCQHFADGRCRHPSAPPKLFSKPVCILTDPKRDLRVAISCTLKCGLPADKPHMMFHAAIRRRADQ